MMFLSFGWVEKILASTGAGFTVSWCKALSWPRERFLPALEFSFGAGDEPVTSQMLEGGQWRGNTQLTFDLLDQTHVRLHLHGEHVIPDLMP